VLTVHEDPRVGESAGVMAGLRAQLDLEQKNVDGMAASNTGYSQASQLRSELKALTGQQLPPAVSQAVSALDSKTAPVEGQLSAAVSGPYGVPAYTGNPGFTGVNGAFAGLMVIVEYESDHEPVDAQVKAFHDYCTDLDNNLALWRTLNTVDVPALNELLRRNNLKPVTAASVAGDLACGAVPAGFAGAPGK
jgi:predicted Fe-Mo cluster-binding NifX family protein